MVFALIQIVNFQIQLTCYRKLDYNNLCAIHNSQIFCDAIDLLVAPFDLTDVLDLPDRRERVDEAPPLF